jgi:hypothetical protein
MPASPHSPPAAPSAAVIPATKAPAGATEASSTPAATVWPAKIEMQADTVDVPAADSSARVIVRRKGSLRGESAFTWWTESGTAKPGSDFQPMVPRVERFQDGKSSVSLDIPLARTLRAQAKSFYVVIDMP